ncbi:unnamed protein product [Alopecurus aequalis]
MERHRELCLQLLGIILTGFVLSVSLICLLTFGNKPPLYSVAIDSVSGLDDGALRSRPTDLNPVFKLTLRVTTRSILISGRVAPHSLVEVTYAGVPLAAVTTQPFCAKKTEEKSVTVWGTVVQVPGFALDSLAADARRGAHVFDVAVTMPGTQGSGHGRKLVSCRGLRVGDGSTLGAPCAASDVDAFVSLPRPSGKDGGAS